MADDVLELPQFGSNRLVAHLLGNRDAVGFDLAVGVVGAAADEDAALPADQHELDLAAGIFAADLDAVLQGDPPRRASVVDRRRSWPRDADRFELSDVLVARYRITAGPAGDDGLVDRKCQRRARALVFDGKSQIKHG